jgi:hypothetical protein
MVAKNNHQLVSNIMEAVMKEYYRGFEKTMTNHPVLRAFKFENLESALEMLLKNKDFQEFFGPRVTKVKDIVNSSTNLATVEYVLDLMADNLKGKEELDWVEDVEAAIEDVADDSDKGDVGDDYNAADEEADQLRLTKVPVGDLRSAIAQLRNKGIGAEKFKKIIMDAVTDLIQGASMAPFIAKKIADEDAPILFKIGDEISKILDGDLSNIKESTRRTK